MSTTRSNESMERLFLCIGLTGGFLGKVKETFDGGATGKDKETLDGGVIGNGKETLDGGATSENMTRTYDKS